MKYSIGQLVVLASDKTIYITGYNEETDKYEGFDADCNNPEELVVFKEDDVIMTV